LLIAAVTAVGCNPSDDGGPTETVEGALSSTEQCGTLSADAVLKGGGAVRSSATYGRSACFDGFLVDINNYSQRNTEGTRVTYGRIAPTTQAACENIEVRAYIFKKNSDGTAPFMTNKVQRGVWVTDASSGVGRCSTPSILLERDIPGYAPGASYRLALRAAQVSPYQRQEVYVETQMPTIAVPPAHQLNSLAVVQENLHSVTPGAIDPAIQAIYSAPGGAQANIECRLMQLELSALKVMEPQFVRAGASSATVSRRTSTVDAVYQGHCVRRDDTIQQFQSRVSDELDALLAMQGEIAGAIGSSFGEAAEVMAAIWHTELARIQAGCGSSPNEVLGFLASGTVPAGMTGPNVLLRSCAGTPSATQSALGIASRPNIGATLKSCIVNSFNGPKLASKSACHEDPRADGPAGNDAGGGFPECKTSASSAACIQRLLGVSPPTAAQKELTERLTKLDNAYWEAVIGISRAEERAAQLALSSAEHALDAAKLGQQAATVNLEARLLAVTAAAELATGDPLSAAADEAMVRVLDADAAMLSLESANASVKSAQENLDATKINQGEIPKLKEKEEKSKAALCKEAPATPGCVPIDDPRKQCPEWEMESGPVWVNSEDSGQEMNMANRVEQCTCEAIKSIAGSFTRNGVAMTVVCETDSEKTKNACVGGIATMPNPDTCWDYMQPGEVDRDALRADMCQHILCPADNLGVVVDKVCRCLKAPTDATLASTCNFNGAAGSLRCGADAGLVCDALGARCVGYDAGRKPLATPGCRVPTGIQLGGRNEWGFVNTSDVFAATFPSRPSIVDRDIFMVKQGFISMAAPELNTNMYSQIGNALRVSVLGPDVVPTGDRGSLQLYCSNAKLNISNAFCGQKEFTNIVAGQLNSFDFALPSACTACIGDGTTNFRWGLGFRTPTNQTTRAGLAGFQWTGTMTNRPNVVPGCDPEPVDPSPSVDPIKINQLLGNGTIRLGAIDGIYVAPWTYPLSSGTASGTVPVVIR
jgi:hypothetical protein